MNFKWTWNFKSKAMTNLFIGELEIVLLTVIMVSSLAFMGTLAISYSVLQFTAWLFLVYMLAKFFQLLETAKREEIEEETENLMEAK